MITIETLVIGCPKCGEQREGGSGEPFCPVCGHYLTAGHICCSCEKFRDDPDGWDPETGKCRECREAGR